MTTALLKSNERLSKALNRTLMHLITCYKSEDRLGATLGITGSAVNKIKNDANWPAFTTGWRIALLGSALGIDLLPDVMSIDGKRTLPVPAHFEGLLNGAILDEYADSGEHLGHCLTLFRDGCLDEAERRVKKAIGALYKMLAEIEARRRAAALPTGDALPSRPLADGLAA